jgi:hypothetical protein
MRIASLISSGTEILCSLGLDDHVVARLLYPEKVVRKHLDSQVVALVDTVGKNEPPWKSAQ